MDSNAFIFFGRSGCGKGTQAKLIQEYLTNKDKKSLYVETGAGLRDLAKRNNYSGEITRNILGEGGLFPVFLPVWIWSNFLIDNFTGKENLILDGVCRRITESMALDSALGFYNVKNRYVILMDVSRHWAFDRLKNRGRADDTDKSINNRLDWFEKDTIPAIDYFKNNSNYKFIKINGEQTIEEVHKDILKDSNL